MHGYVRQPDGTPLPGATVTLIDPSGRQAAHGQSDAGGAYQVCAPAPGPYTLIAMAPPTSRTRRRCASVPGR